MKYFKVVVASAIMVVFLIGILGVSQGEFSMREALSQLLKDSYWAINIYDGWLDKNFDFSFADLLEDEPDGSIGDKELVWFYSKYEKRADELYKKLMESRIDSLELTIAVAQYRSALIDIKKVLQKEKFTKQDANIMSDAYRSIIEAGERFFELHKKFC